MENNEAQKSSSIPPKRTRKKAIPVNALTIPPDEASATSEHPNLISDKPGKSRKFSLSDFGDWLAKTKGHLENIRSIVISATVFMLFGVLGHAVFKEVNTPYVLFDSIEVPEDLVKKGYSGTVIARSMVDEMIRIRKFANDSTTYTPISNIIRPVMGSSKDLPDLNFAVPETDVTFASVVSFFRMYLNRKPRLINGEVISNKDVLRISSRFEGEVVSRQISADSINYCINEVAFELLKIIEPISAANYLYAKTRVDDCEKFLFSRLNYLSDVDQSEAHLILGLLARYERNDSIKAIHYWRLALEENPKNPRVFNNLGILEYEKGHFNEAEAFFLQAKKADENYINAYYGLGTILRDKGHSDEAEVFYRQALELNPKAADSYIYLGLIKLNQGRLDEAEVLYRKAIRLAPNNAYAHHNLGLIKGGQGNLKEAEDCYSMALRLNPKNADTYINLGVIKLSQDSLKKAEYFYSQALKLNPKDADIYFNLGIIKDSQDSLKEAANFYHQALRLNPRDTVTYFNLGAIKDKQGNLKEAEYFYRKALKLDPKNVDTYNNLGLVKYKQKSLKEAEYFYRQALKLNPKKPFVLYNLGWVKLDQNKLYEAEYLFGKALKLLPDDAEIYFSLAIIKKKQQKQKEAINFTRQGLKLNPIPNEDFKKELDLEGVGKLNWLDRFNTLQNDLNVSQIQPAHRRR